MNQRLTRHLQRGSVKEALGLPSSQVCLTQTLTHKILLHLRGGLNTGATLGLNLVLLPVLSLFMQECQIRLRLLAYLSHCNFLA